VELLELLEEPVDDLDRVRPLQLAASWTDCHGVRCVVSVRGVGDEPGVLGQVAVPVDGLLRAEEPVDDVH
jgi:hypothetical protein